MRCPCFRAFTLLSGSSENFPTKGFKILPIIVKINHSRNYVVRGPISTLVLLLVWFYFRRWAPSTTVS